MADDSLSHGHPEIGFSTRYAQLLVVGAALVVLGGLLVNLAAVSDRPSESMVHAAQWTGWLGAATVSTTLLLAGATGGGTSPGVRTALVVAGSYLLLTVTLNGFGLNGLLLP